MLQLAGMQCCRIHYESPSANEHLRMRSQLAKRTAEGNRYYPIAFHIGRRIRLNVPTKIAFANNFDQTSNDGSFRCTVDVCAERILNSDLVAHSINPRQSKNCASVVWLSIR